MVSIDSGFILSKGCGMEIKNVYVVLVFLIMVSCTSTKFYYDLDQEGLETLIGYQGKDFVYLPENTAINQLDMDNFDDIFKLNEIVVDRKNPELCIFNFQKPNGEITSVDLSINVYTDAYDNRLAGEYVVCLYNRGYGWYTYYAMDIDGVVNINSSYKKDRVSFQNIVFRNGSVIAKGFHPLDNLKTTYQKYLDETRNSSLDQNRSRRGNLNKLIALLVNPMMAGQFGQFTRDEVVNVPRALLRVIDLNQFENSYMFLVMMNDGNVSKPFYILSNRMLKLIDIDYPNTIFEDLSIQYIRIEEYYSNGISRDTFVFQMISQN
jgi:hypothetical protein